MPVGLSPLQIGFAAGACVIMLLVGIVFCCHWRLPWKRDRRRDSSAACLLPSQALATAEEEEKKCGTSEWPYGFLLPSDVRRILAWSEDVRRTVSPVEEVKVVEVESTQGTTSLVSDSLTCPLLSLHDDTASQCAQYSPRVSALSSIRVDLPLYCSQEPLRL